MSPERDPDRGLRRGARDHHIGERSAGRPVIAELIVDHERGREQRVHHHLHPLAVGPVQRVGGAADVAVVGPGEPGPMDRGVGETTGVGAARGDHQLVRHRQVAVETLTDLDIARSRLDDLAEAPHRHPPPDGAIGLGAIALGRACREHVPVAHPLAEHGVGDVVRGEREGVDRDADLARSELGPRRAAHPHAPQIVADDLDVDDLLDHP